MNITNKNGLPNAYYQNCLRDDHPRYGMDTFSATELLKGTKEIILTHRHWNELEVDCSDMVWLILGKAVHAVFEGHEDEQEISEARVHATVMAYNPATDLWDIPITISGGFDLYNGETKTLTDYKTTQAFGFKMKQEEGTDSDWYRQLKIYWWLLGKNGFEVRKGQIVAILKDYSKAKARLDASYPQLPIQTVTYNGFGNSETAMLFESDLTRKIDQIRAYDLMADDEIPPCTKEERWEKGEKWAVMKNGRKSAIRLLDSEAEARDMADGLGKEQFVTYRPGTPIKCQDYCSACEFCSFYKSLKEVDE